MSRIRRSIAVLAFLLLVPAMFLSGVLAGRQGGLGRCAAREQRVSNFGVFWEAWDKLEQKFWSPNALDHQQMTYGAIRGMLVSLADPYSVFLEPSQHQLDSDRLQGEFGGIGVEIGLEEARAVVLWVHPGSPAEAAGILAGDIIISVSDNRAMDLSVDEVLLLIRGPVGSVVKITLQRYPGNVLTVDIERQPIQIPSLAWEVLSPRIGYVHIRFFSDRTPDELAEALGRLTHSDTHAMILDLRGNGGGVVHAAVGVLGQLLGGGIAYRELEKGAKEVRYPVPFDSKPIDWPLAVLVDAGTASSAEIVAAAIRDRRRGLLYGQTTFGKGSVQAVFPLDDGSSVHLTSARWLSSDGHVIDGVGIVPDVVIDTSHRREEDVTLQAALADLQLSLAQPAANLVLLCHVDHVREE